MRNEITIGIDATNIRGGGGITHLIELLIALRPQQLGIQKVVVWGGERTISMLPNRSWLSVNNPKMLNKGLFCRTIWQIFSLSNSVRSYGCDVLFVPGGSYVGSFKPVVTMSQNLLPFENSEIKRFGISTTIIRLLLLRYVQSSAFKKSEGTIFLTEYARQMVENHTGKLSNTTLIPHGISTKFFKEPRRQCRIDDYSDNQPFKVLYVSIVNQYKHQWHVVNAIAKLRAKYGYPIELNLVGPSFLPAMNRLQQQIDYDDPYHKWVRYHGSVSHDELVEYYSSSDLGVFASSCENLPIILLEKMASGLPVACSNKGPMPEVLGGSDFYFDPENSSEMSDVINKLVCSPEFRYELAQSNYKKSQFYSWSQCASKTFNFLVEISNKSAV